MFAGWTRAAFLLMFVALPALAQAEPAPPASLASNLLGMAPFVLMFAVVYVLMMRPAQQQRAKHDALLAALKKDDEVVTQSGFIGRIASLSDEVVTLEVAERVRVRMLKDRIVGPFVAAKAGGNKPAASLQADQAR